MRTHTFAVCAYGDSPYLKTCLRSLKRQSTKSGIILCTSTPSAFLRKTAGEFDIPLYVRTGEGGIALDWNFAFRSAPAGLVTLAHQDDWYARDYTRTVQDCWEKYPDTSVFMTDCALVRQGSFSGAGSLLFIKRLLRLPLSLRPLADRTAVKRAALAFGNPVICPSCTYDRERTGDGLFDPAWRYALDWDALWRLAAKEGRFVCAERPLIAYRIHAQAATKACIDNASRRREEARMFKRIWKAALPAGLLTRFYAGAAAAYEDL